MIRPVNVTVPNAVNGKRDHLSTVVRSAISPSKPASVALEVEFACEDL